MNYIFMMNFNNFFIYMLYTFWHICQCFLFFFFEILNQTSFFMTLSISSKKTSNCHCSLVGLISHMVFKWQVSKVDWKRLGKMQIGHFYPLLSSVFLLLSNGETIISQQQERLKKSPLNSSDLLLGLWCKSGNPWS